MSRPAKQRAPGPPDNPGLRELVADKRRWASQQKPNDAKQGFRGWHERGYLPHRDEPGLTQFVTFRLADSFPEAVRSEWEHLWRIEDMRRRRAELESYLDKGRGECHLAHSDITKLVEDALLRFHGHHYDLRAWVVMPNHVHVLFKVETKPMAEILESWKKYTAFKANRWLGRRGAFWQADYWDTFMRDDAQELKSRVYLENNPLKAKLVLDSKEWARSSARLRDNFGRLLL